MMYNYKIIALATAVGCHVTQAVKIAGDNSGSLETGVYDDSKPLTTDGSSGGGGAKTAALIGGGVVVCVGLGVGLGVGLTQGSDSSSGNSLKACPLHPRGTLDLDNTFAMNDCDIIEGDLIVQSSFAGDLNLDDYLPNLQYITGDLRIEGANDLLSFTSQKKVGWEYAIEGSVIVNGNENLQIFDMQHVSEIGGEIRVLANPSLEIFGTPYIRFLGGDLVVQDNDVLPTLDLEIPNLDIVAPDVEFGGAFRISSNHNLDRVVLPTFKTMGGDVQVNNNDELTYFSLGRIDECPGSIRIHDNPKLTDANSQFRDVLGAIEVYNNGAQQDETIEFPSLPFLTLRSVGEHINIRDNSWSTMSLNLERLEFVGTNLEIKNNGDMSMKYLRSISNVEGDLRIEDMKGEPNFGQTFDFPFLRNVGGDFAFINNPDTQLMDAPQLNFIGENGGNLYIENNPKLVFTGFGALQSVDNIRIVGNAQECSPYAEGWIRFDQVQPRGRVTVSDNDCLSYGVSFRAYPSLAEFDGLSLEMENNGQTLTDRCTVYFAEESIAGCAIDCPTTPCITQQQANADAEMINSETDSIIG